MNIPSTFPAPRVKQGFFISGAGGGLSQKSAGKVPEGLAFPTEISKSIVAKEYIFDIRLMSSGIRDIDTYFDSLASMTSRRTSLYLELAQKHKPSAGFAAYMGLCRLQCVAMSEVEALIANSCQPASPIQNKILNLYRQFDDEIRRLFKGLNPNHFILTADHGQAPYLYTINVNAFLQQSGFLCETSQPGSMRRQLKNGVKTGLRAVVPETVRFKLFKNRLNQPSALKIQPDWSSTLAFGARYVPGIYVNDPRFNGPVKAAEVDDLVKKLIDILNKSDEAKMHKLNAVPYRQCFPDAYCNALLPDIWIEHPDTHFFVEHGPFVGLNKDYGPIKSLWQVTRDMFSGIKGSNPLVFHDTGLSGYIKETDPKDLTTIYHLALRSIA